MTFCLLLYDHLFSIHSKCLMMPTAKWNKIAVGFNRDDETVNFGTRKVAENNGSIYEASTLAIIESDVEATGEPCVLATIQYTKLFIAIDKTINIFENETCEEVLLSLNFESLITCYRMSENGFLFIALDTGVLYCLYLPTRDKLVFKKNVINNKNDSILKILIKQGNNDELIDVILITKDGIVYGLLNIDIKQLEYAASEMNKEALDEIVKDINCSELFIGLIGDQVLDATAYVLQEEILTVMVGSNFLFTWPNQQYSDLGNLLYGYKKVQFLRNHNLLLCLTTDCMLNVVCPLTLLAINVYSKPVKDFTIIEDDNSDNCQILLLMMPENTEATSCTLKFVSYPGFEEKFKIDVSIATYLTEVIECTTDAILFLEGAAGTIGVKNISETMPEYRLERLLKRRHIDAAEDFAKKFNLSMEPVYCSKAALMVEWLNPWSKTRTESIQLDMFIDILDKIQDVQYVVNCCNNTLIPRYKDMRKLFLYGQQRVIQDIQKMESNELLNLLSVINNTLCRLDTFEMIWETRVDTEYYNDQILKEWLKFLRVDLFEEYKIYLRKGELEAATLIWKRHSSELMNHITLKAVQDIFAIIPENMLPSQLRPWLLNFIPILLSTLPNAICEITHWGCKTIKSFEQHYRALWPQIAIDFGNEFINLLKFERNHMMYFHQEYINQNADLKQLIFLLQTLSDLQQLKVNHRITISLNAYTNQPMEVAHILLEKIHINDIPEFLEKFLKQYMLNNSLQNDAVIISHIQKTIRNSKSWWCGETAPWEKRVACLIGFIHNIQARLLQILEVLRKAPVPWSSTMTTLAEMSNSIDHELSYKIHMERNYIPVKLILKKYGYQTIGINDKLISRITKENRSEMVADLHELTKSDCVLKQKAFSSCINYHVIKGNTDKAVEILNNLEENIVIYCCEQMINYIIAYFSLKDMPEYVSYCIETMSWIEHKLNNIAKICKTQLRICNNIIASINDVRSVYLLKAKYSVNITFAQYHTMNIQILQNSVKELSNDQSSFSKIQKTAIRISELLGFRKLDALSFLLESTKNVNILKYFIECNGTDLNVAAEEYHVVNRMCLFTLKNIELNAETISIIKNLSTSALCTCPDVGLNDALSCNAWINLYFECAGEQNLNFRKKYELLKINLCPIYKDLAVSSEQLLLPLLKDTLSIHMALRCPYSAIPEKTDAHSMINDLLVKMQQQQVEHSDYTLFQTIKTLYYSCCFVSADETLLREIRSTLFHFVITLLRKIINARSFDLQLALSCLFILPEKEASTWLFSTCKSLLMDYTRHSVITSLGFEYFYLMRNEVHVQIFQYQKMLHHWAQKLSDYSIAYKEMMTSDTASRRQILQRFMSCNNNDNIIPLLEDFCSSFGFNLNDCFLLYLKVLMKTWNPTTSMSNIGGKKEISIPDNEVHQLKWKAQQIIAKITDNAALNHCVSDLHNQINFYYYEIFIILMDLVNAKNLKLRSYLCFLQNYTRSSMPSRMEHEEWMHLNAEHTSLPSIATWRFPFLPTLDPWKLIKPELNLKTYSKWLEIAPVLKLQPHIICTLAIKGEVSQIWKSFSSLQETNKWALYPKYDCLLKDIKKCIQCMNDPNALYYGTAALYYVVNYTPPGADRVAAAQECYNYAQLAAKENTLEEGMLEKIKCKYLRFTSEHILHTHGLQKPHYLSLIENPDELVYKLYLDESIPLRYQTALSHRPDVNSAVDALGKLFSLNLVKLRFGLLEEWLQPNMSGRINQSFTETISIVPNSKQSPIYDDNLFRACYILEHMDIELSANVLINIGFGDSNEDNYPSEVRYRALHVLQAITDEVTLQDLTKRDLQVIRKYMKSLKYISKLETLGFDYSVNKFETCSKSELAKILWETRRRSPQALSLIAQICVDYEIYDYSLWNENLTQIAKLGMIHDLKQILLQVRNISVIANSSGYALGWQIIIEEPFRKMDVEPNQEQIDNCINALHLLQFCPVAHELQYTDIIKYCFQSQQAYLSAALLSFLNDTDKKYVLEVINGTLKTSKVVEELKQLSSRGVLTISHCLTILQQTSPKT